MAQLKGDGGVLVPALSDTENADLAKSDLN